jgi:hypothetical protein
MGQCRVPGPRCAESNPDDDQFPPGSGFEDPGVVGLDTSGGSSAGAITGWPRSIAWSEFNERNSRPEGVDEDAQIHSEVQLSPEVTVESDNGKLKLGSFTVQVVVISEDTWVVKGHTSTALLAHEQGHYDITGLVGRDTMNDLKALRARSSRDLQRDVDRILRNARQLAKTLTDKYDSETNHSQNTRAQQEWEKKIRDALQNGTRLSP